MTNELPKIPPASSLLPDGVSDVDAMLDSNLFQVEGTQDFTASWAGSPFDYDYSIPIGWGYMDPAIVTNDGDVYIPEFYPCSVASLAEKAKYCLLLEKNGEPWSPVLQLAENFLPNGMAGIDAYQPPMLFLSPYGWIMVAYWVEADSQAGYSSIIQMVSIDTADPSQWHLVSQYISDPGKTMNYLGGARGPSGEIYIAGWVSGGGANSLALLRALPENSYYFEAPQTITQTGSSFAPLYPIVAVDAAGQVNILSTFDLEESCSQTGLTYTNYKDVVYYRGSFGGSFDALWSDAAPDMVANGLGDPCLYNDSRFGTDLIYDASQDRILFVFRASNLEAGAGDEVQDNSDYIESFPLYQAASGGVPTALNSDLSQAFSSVFPDPNAIQTISLGQSGDRFLVVAVAWDGSAAFVTANSDFTEFGPAQQLSAPFGVGDSVKISQPNKNGSDPTDDLYLFFSGFLTGPANNFLQTRLTTMGLN